MKYTIHTDGGSRGNPGQAAYGVVIETTDTGGGESITPQGMPVRFGKRIGITTNNVAEYSGVVAALEFCIAHRKKAGDAKQDDYHFFLDSTLVVNQLNGVFKIKDARLREYLSKIRILEQDLGGSITYAYVPREQNAEADREVNAALDRSL